MVTKDYIYLHFARCCFIVPCSHINKDCNSVFSSEFSFFFYIIYNTFQPIMQHLCCFSMYADETWLLNSCSCIFFIKLRMYSVASSFTECKCNRAKCGDQQRSWNFWKPPGHTIHLQKQHAGRPENLVTDAIQYKQMVFALGSRMKVCLKQYSGICPGFNTEKLLPWNVVVVMNRAIQLPHKETQLFPFNPTDELVHL